MAQLALASTFIETIPRMSSADTHDVVAMLERVLAADDATGSGRALIEEGAGREVEAIRVNDHLFAIARHCDGETLVLYAADGGEALRWARANCSGCDRPPKGQWVAFDHLPGEHVFGLVPSGPCGAWFCTVANTWQLGRVIESASDKASHPVF